MTWLSAHERKAASDAYDAWKDALACGELDPDGLGQVFLPWNHPFSRSVAAPSAAAARPRGDVAGSVSCARLVLSSSPGAGAETTTHVERPGWRAGPS